MVRAALQRLAYPGAAQPILTAHLGAAPGAKLGVVNAAQLWSAGPQAGGLVALFDGDLYERDFLCKALEVDSADYSAAGASDARLIGLAYQRWGETFPVEIDGEFAFAVWDGVRQRLVLGRDAMGRAALHYGTTPNSFVFASEPRGLQGWPGLDCRVDEEQIARLLSAQLEPGRTLFRGIRYVPGGHVLVVERNQPAKPVRYWFPHQQPQMRVRDEREYAEALRSAMQRAVERRLPANGLVGSHLSAGFDSSGVTALAAQALARQGRPLVAYTSVPVHRGDAQKILKGRFGDEWPLAHAVAAMYPNVEHVPIRTDAGDCWEAIDTPAEVWAAPMAFIRNAQWFHAIHRDAQRRGLSVVLEASMGNLTGSYDGQLGLFDMRKRGGNWKDLARAVRRRRKAGEKWRPVLQAVWMPSARAKERVQRLYGKRARRFYEWSLMRPEFYASTGLPPIHLSPLGALVLADRTSGAAWRLSILQMRDFGMDGAGMMRHYGIKLVDPTADRRLAELCLRIPDEAFRTDGRKRELYRRAMQADLPAELLDEPLRGLQSSDFLELFAQSLPEFQSEMERLRQSPSVGRYLDLERMQALLDSWPGADCEDKATADAAYNYTFGGALAMGRFLRRLEDGTGQPG